MLRLEKDKGEESGTHEDDDDGCERGVVQKLLASNIVSDEIKTYLYPSTHETPHRHIASSCRFGSDVFIFKNFMSSRLSLC